MNRRKTRSQLARLNRNTLPAAKKIVTETQAHGVKNAKSGMDAQGSGGFSKRPCHMGQSFRFDGKPFHLLDDAAQGTNLRNGFRCDIP
ncbi:MAG: hypothetical protein AB8D78_12865 [Akkermansiaceae bacterium]